MRGTLGILCIVLAVILLGIGVYLIPATMWRNICIGFMIIGIVLIVLGIFLVKKRSYEKDIKQKN